MSPKTLTSRHSIDSCVFQLHSWSPFSPNSKTLTLETSDSNLPPAKPSSTTKRPCLSDRTTSLFSLSIDTIDFSKLSLFDDGAGRRGSKIRWVSRRKRRRRGSRSVSGRSSDRSGTTTRNNGGRCYCSVGATATATATCSDFMVVNEGTDSSGELFGHVGVNGNGNGWGSDVNEARRDRGNANGGNGGGEREGFGVGFGVEGVGNESGYGSEPGYRGDAEFGYGDEVDDDDDDCRLLLWGERFGDTKVEMVGENTFSEQKAHHRGRRKKHDWRIVDSST